MAQNMQAQSTKERTNEQDVFNMRVNMAQLKTQEDRLLQEKQLKAQQMLNTENAIRAASGLPPLTSLPGMGGQGVPMGQQGVPAAQGAPMGQQGAPVAQGAPGAVQGAPTGDFLTPAQQANIRVLAQSNPDEAIKQVLALTKPDDIVRRLRAAGIQPGTPEYNAALFTNIIGANALNPQDVRTSGGTVQQTPFGAATALLGGKPPVAAPAPVAAPVAAPTAAVTPAAPPMAPTVATAPAAPAIFPAAAPAPAQRSPFAPGSKEDLAWQTAQAQAKIDVEKERQTETNKQAIAVASKASEELQASADSADNNIIVANRISQNVQKVPELVNLLGRDTVQSAILNLADLGLRTPMGSIGINDVNQLAVQLDPSIRNIKDPKVKEARLSAAQQLARDFAFLSLQGSKMIQGQGAVSDNERALIKQATGDPSRLTAQNIVLVSRAVKYEAMNAKERRDLWNQMESKGMTYQQFRKSPEMLALKKDQYDRMTKVLGLSNAPAFDPALERS
jgi:hypothetical protein